NVAHEQVPPYLNAMNMLLAPSQTTRRWREQFGRMLIEAFACGVPVIGSDSGEIPYVIGDAGYVLPENDATAWTETITTLLHSPQLRNDFSQRGLQRAHDKFSWTKVAHDYLDFFSELIEGKAALRKPRFKADVPA